MSSSIPFADREICMHRLIAEHIAQAGIDIVLLQEVFVKSDTEHLTATAAQCNLHHAQYLHSGFLGGELLILSRWPILYTRSVISVLVWLQETLAIKPSINSELPLESCSATNTLLYQPTVHVANQLLVPAFAHSDAKFVTFYCRFADSNSIPWEVGLKLCGRGTG